MFAKKLRDILPLHDIKPCFRCIVNFSIIYQKQASAKSLHEQGIIALIY